MRTVAAALAAAFIALPAAAQAPAADPTLVSEFVVTARTPGPAWWRVADDDSEVYILIVPNAAITGLTWPREPLERRMKGANVFILPFQLSIADLRSAPGAAGILVQAPKLLLARKPKKQARDPRPLEEQMPPELRAKFVAAREKIGQPASRYATLAPWQAGRALDRDYRAHLKLTGGDFGGGALLREIQGLAKRNKVRVEAAYKITVPVVKLNVQTTDEPTAEVAWGCLEAALPRIAARAERDRAAVLAWAAGDVRPLLNPQPPPPADPKCQAPGIGASYNEKPESNGPITRMEEAFVRDQAAAVERALKTPGRSVAILEPLSPLGRAEMGLLGKKGVLARLRERGYEITAPDDLD